MIHLRGTLIRTGNVLIAYVEAKKLSKNSAITYYETIHLSGKISCP